MGEHFSKQERKFGKGGTVKSFADIDKLDLGKKAAYKDTQTNGEPKEKNNSKKIVKNIEKTEKEKIINSIPENITKDDLLCIDKLEDGKYVEGCLLGLLRNSPIEVGKNIETAMGHSTKVAEIKQIGELYFIKTMSGSEYRFDPKKSIKNPGHGGENIEKEITEKASNPEEFKKSEKLPAPLAEQFEKIRKTDAVKQSIEKFIGKNKALKNVDLEEFTDRVVNRFLRYYKDVDKDGRPVEKEEGGISIKDIIEKSDHVAMLAKLINGAAEKESEYILGNAVSNAESKKENIIEKLKYEDISKLTYEDINESIRSGHFIEVKALKNSGEIEDGWTISGGLREDGLIAIYKPIGNGRGIVMRVSLEDLKKWNGANLNSENQENSGLKIEKSESPVEIKPEINNDEKEPATPEFATRVAKKPLHIEDEPELITPGSIEDQRQKFVEKEMESAKDFILMQMKTFSSKKEREEFLEGLKLAAEERFNSQQEQIGKIKSELEVVIRDYAEIKYKKRKSWENMVGFLGKKDVQERFDNDSEVSSMKKAYLEKMAEYKKALISNAKKGGLTNEEAAYRVTDIMLDEMDKLFEANMEVRTENNEKALTDKLQETFAKYNNKITPPIKEADAHNSKGKGNAEFHADNLIIKKADNSTLNKEKITDKNIKPENVPTNEKPKNHVRSEWEEIIEIMDIKSNSNTRMAAINIKSGIFGKSNQHFLEVIDKNLTEIMNSKTAKEAFLEKIPKSGRTFFNKLIKQVPPKPGDTIKKWLVRAAVEAKENLK